MFSAGPSSLYAFPIARHRSQYRGTHTYTPMGAWAVHVRVRKTEQKEERDRARQRRTHRLELETWPRTGEENNRFYSTHVSDGYFCFSGDEKDMRVEVLALKHGHIQKGQERCDDTFQFMTFWV